MSISRKAARWALAMAFTGLPLVASAHELGRHSMEGTIVSLDKHTGFMHVRTSMGTLIEHFPPRSESHLHVGQHIKLYLGFKALK